MSNDGISKEVLKEISDRLVVKKEEIVRFLQGKVDDPKGLTESLIKDFLSKGFVRTTPVGDSTFAITQRGMKEVI